MNKTRKLLLTLLGTVLAGSLTGCAPDQQALFEQPSQPPQIAGYDDDDWVWDPVDGEWEYQDDDGMSYFYHGSLFKKSIKSSGLKSTAAPIVKSSSKLGGFGSGSKGGSFGG